MEPGHAQDVLDLVRRSHPDSAWSMISRQAGITRIFQSVSHNGPAISMDVADGDWVVAAPGGPLHLTDALFRQSYDPAPGS